MSLALSYLDPGAEAAGELYGLWRTQPGEIAGVGKDAVSFGVDLPARADMPLGGVWRIDAARSEAVDRVMAEQAGRLLEAGRSLDEVVLDDEQAAALAVAARTSPLTAVGKEQGALAAFLEQAGRQVQYYAWVETAEEGRLVARSTVNWFGHLDTFWKVNAMPSQQTLHRRSLELALATRLTTVKTALTVVKWIGVVAQVSALSGPALVVALPGLVWRAVNEIIYPIIRSDLFQRS